MSAWATNELSKGHMLGFGISKIWDNEFFVW